MIAVLRREIQPNELLPPVLARHTLQRRIDLLVGIRECLGDSFSEKLVLAPEVLVKAADSKARCLHNACDAGTAEPFSAKLASSVSHDTIAGSRFVFRFVAHTAYWIIHIIQRAQNDFDAGEQP